jgi:Fe-S-cluster containining protein
MTEHEHDDDDGLLDEYRAVIAKVDAAVATISARAADALACRRGCDSCCAPGLSVLPVEAESIARHLEAHHVPAGTRADRCTFLDDDGACRIYAVRPVLCRTHGLALKAGQSRPGLTIVDDVSHCALNYTARTPQPAEVLDAERLLALLVTVDRRFRVAAGLDDDGSRIALASLLD